MKRWKKSKKKGFKDLYQRENKKELLKKEAPLFGYEYYITI